MDYQQTGAGSLMNPTNSYLVPLSPENSDEEKEVQPKKRQKRSLKSVNSNTKTTRRVVCDEDNCYLTNQIGKGSLLDSLDTYDVPLSPDNSKKPKLKTQKASQKGNKTKLGANKKSNLVGRGKKCNKKNKLEEN